jgi:hypothetical protein
VDFALSVYGVRSVYIRVLICTSTVACTVMQALLSSSSGTYMVVLCWFRRNTEDASPNRWPCEHTTHLAKPKGLGALTEYDD